LLLRTVVDVAYLALIYSFYDRYLSFVRIGDAVATSIPTYVRVVGALVIADFALWWHHLFMHKVKFFWVFHSVHHSQRELNIFTNLRFHVGEVLVSRTIRYTPLYILNLDFQLAVWIPVVIEAYERVYHANLRTGYGLLKYVLVTPQSHRIHHSADKRHFDKNFGILFSFWDRLFGTQWANYDEYPGTGINDQGFPAEQSATTLGTPATYFSQFAYPFACLIQAARGNGWELGPREENQEDRGANRLPSTSNGRTAPGGDAAGAPRLT
jgi:sterol desaturase/sphingolipid hydroxylase (fatty acid hydroxylase superfamily)